MGVLCTGVVGFWLGDGTSWNYSRRIDDAGSRIDGAGILARGYWTLGWFARAAGVGRIDLVGSA